MSIEKKIKYYTQEECLGTKYFYIAHILGVLATVFTKAGVPKTNPIPNEYFEIFKDTLTDIYFGGIEPEFESDNVWDEWDVINSENYIFITEEEFNKNRGLYNPNARSPYSDKTVPYLVRLLKS